ncbi:helicase C-terminal domain-containing protein [Fusarium redolens]|uniref:ATP-dependent DNA helicase CHL1 n=1 Tax=Fusarium redolens TaxID=48865 RepID=A0A9P9KA91_FUSRE|nr:helicase C-terminal domain-containing protein [Fusarium redolens]KAH7253828.1 helicase C-terminal domain-containing protein [Fusarium redolens]
MAQSEVDKVTQDLEKLDFHHPYTPYDVQEQFMKAVYNVLETGNGQVGILESPTGTGKSLSLICASLTWLRNHKSNQFEASIQESADAYKDEPSWLVEQLLRRKREELVTRWEEREKRLESLRLKEKAQEERARKRRRVDDYVPSKSRVEDEDAEWLLDDPDDRDAGPQDALSGLSKETREVLASIGLGGAKKPEEEDDFLEEEIKIYYTSRTHSQLSQFITELRRPSFPPSLPTSLAKNEESKTEAVKLLPLSSRQRLCINPAVSRLGSVQAINDRCSELQQPKSGQKCPFVPKEDLLSQTHQFRDSALATLPDIEDLHQLGKSLAVCPYYASRTALPGAEIITLPYPLLLQKSARDALGVKLEGSVVIIDEAHNIMDAVANVHAAEIKLSDIRRGRAMLGVYVKKFGKKLKGVNRVNVGRVGRVIEGLGEWMDGALKFKQEHGIVDPNDLTRPKGIDQINMFELIQYIQESKLAFKIESYISHVESENANSKTPRSSSPVLHTLVSFLIAFTNLSSEGRIFYQKIKGPTPDIQLSYLLLSPTYAFSSIASSARAVVLAGGTMSPFDDYKDHLFPSLEPDKITTLSCGHVIPPENLCVWTLASSRPGAPPFEFSFQKRGDTEMITQLGLAILNLCSLVPDGVVIFFPSYGYLDEVVNVWQKSHGNAQPIWDRLGTRKALFKESRGASSDEVLQEYSDAILGEKNNGKGALLLSVVGGKMSEGINFSDRLGRCVIVIGLPYPNIASPDWKAKIEYIETTTQNNLTAQGVAKEEAISQGKQTARDFYENACMRAVNQSIGRAIRHRGDYAAIVLVDRRYGTERIRGKLPGWIRGGLVKDSHEKGLGGVMGAVGGFFRGKKSQNQ